MAEFFKTSTIWVVDFRFDGKARRWFKAFGPTDDVSLEATATLDDLYGKRAKLVQVRPATAEEEAQYLRAVAGSHRLWAPARRCLELAGLKMLSAWSSARADLRGQTAPEAVALSDLDLIL